MNFIKSKPWSTHTLFPKLALAEVKKRPQVVSEATRPCVKEHREGLVGILFKKEDSF
jgi:hypothetical protein